MMMLTTDMCLAYAYSGKNHECRDAMDKDLPPYSQKCLGDPILTDPDCHAARIYKEAKNIYCRGHYMRAGPLSPHRDFVEGWQDLDPTKHNCCAWTSHLSLVATGVLPNNAFVPYAKWAKFNPSKEIDYCGVKYKIGPDFDRNDLDKKGCCALKNEHGSIDHECDD